MMGQKSMGVPLGPAEKEHKEDKKEFVCAAGAAFANIIITFPMNKVMFRQQLSGIRVRTAVHQLQSEGLRNLFRGLLPPLLQKTASLSVMFGMYNKHLRYLNETRPDFGLRVNQTIAAMIAGTYETFLTPFERVQTLLQDRNFYGKYQNTTHAFRELRVHGFKEYYRGLTAIFIRNGPSNVLFFVFRGPIKERLPESHTKLGNFVADFISGACLGALISTIFFPINVVKTQMQCRVGEKYLSLSEAFRAVYNERGQKWTKLFRGVHINYTRSLVSWGIINATYELIRKLVFDGD